MVGRIPIQQLSRATAITAFPSSFFSQRLPPSVVAARNLATISPPAQSSAGGAGGGKGTAIVLLNMGGPSTVPEVHDFLSRLFVFAPSHHLPPSY